MPTETTRERDVQVVNQGTVFAFFLFTDRAREWVNEHVQLEGWQWLGGMGFAVDHRYAADLAEGMLDAGLEVV